MFWTLIASNVEGGRNSPFIYLSTLLIELECECRDFCPDPTRFGSLWHFCCTHTTPLQPNKSVFMVFVQKYTLLNCLIWLNCLINDVIHLLILFFHSVFVSFRARCDWLIWWVWSFQLCTIIIHFFVQLSFCKTSSLPNRCFLLFITSENWKFMPNYLAQLHATIEKRNK